MAEVSGTASPDDSYSATPDTSALSSESSASFSDLVSSVISHKEKSAAQKWSKIMKKKKKKREEKKKKNKISKTDFYAKLAEFKVWLSEVKKQKFENLNQKQQKEFFKKFVKKWNAQKLDTKYYRGVLWAVGTPDTQTSWAMPHNVDVTPGSVGEDVLEEKYSRIGASQAIGLGTFGKSTGADILKELRSMENTQNSTCHDKRQDTVHKDGSKSIPLQQLFLPTQQNCSDNTDKKLKQLTSDNWPAPPSPCLNAVETHRTNTQNKLMSKMSDADDVLLPPYPHTSHLGQRGHSNKLIKVDVPSIQPLGVTKPSVGPKPVVGKTRPVSCIVDSVPKRAPTPPKRSTSSENIKPRHWMCVDGEQFTSQVSREDHSVGEHRASTDLDAVKLAGAPKCVTGLERIDNNKPPSSTDVKNHEMLSTNKPDEMTLARKRCCSLLPTASCQKRHLTRCDSLLPKDGNMGMGDDNKNLPHRPQSLSGEPQPKLLRHDSYASTLSSASHVVLETLNSTRANVDPGLITPVRITYSQPHGTTSGHQQEDGIQKTSGDEQILTPGKSSVSTLL